MSPAIIHINFRMLGEGKVGNAEGETVKTGAGRENAGSQCGRIAKKEWRTAAPVTELAGN